MSLSRRRSVLGAAIRPSLRGCARPKSRTRRPAHRHVSFVRWPPTYRRKRTGLFSPELRLFTFSTMSVIAVAAYNNLSVSAALPAIGDDLGHLAWLPWVVTVELVTSAIAVLAVGPVIDSLGTKRVMRVVLIAFIVAAVIAALAPTMAVLIVGRALQGLAVGALIATVMAAMGLAVPEHLRARAYATNAPCGGSWVWPGRRSLPVCCWSSIGRRCSWSTSRWQFSR